MITKQSPYVGPSHHADLNNNSLHDNSQNIVPTELKPVSSSYLVMLRRFYKHLKDNQHSNVAHNGLSPIPNSCEQASPHEYLENSIDLSCLNPIMNDLFKLLGHRAYGIDIGQHMHPSDYGIFGYAMMNCSSVGLALETAARHKAIRNQNMQASFYRTGGSFRYQVDTTTSNLALNILTELDFSTAFEFGKLLVGPHKSDAVRLNSVSFKHAPLGPIKIYQERFKCPVYFEQELNYVCLDSDVTYLPIYAANPKVLNVLESKISSIIAKTTQNEISLAKRVYQVLINATSYQNINSLLIAESFNMSLSNFKKHLKEEGTCFQELFESVRKNKSYKLLSDKQIPIKTVAFELGFSNPSAFNKAFKRWTGNSPLEYRKNRI